MALEDKFAQFETHRNNIRAAEASIEEELKGCSDIIKMIAEEISPKKNVTYNGKKLTIVNRKGTYFFRGLEEKVSDDEIVVIGGGV